jgi:hypothetical protein
VARAVSMLCKMNSSFGLTPNPSPGGEGSMGFIFLINYSK